MSKKSQGQQFTPPLPPTGAFPGYKRGAAVFNIWAEGLFRQTAIWNDVWSKLKGKSMTMDDGVRAFVDSVECTAKATEDMFQAAITNPDQGQKK